MQVSRGRVIRRPHSTSSKGKTAIPTSNSLRTLTCLWEDETLVGGRDGRVRRRWRTSLYPYPPGL